MGPLRPSARATRWRIPNGPAQRALARGEGESRNAALAHILRVERDVLVSAQRLHAQKTFATAFPAGAFGNGVATTAQLAANEAGIAVIRLTLDGFDTHAYQQARQQNLLRQLGDDSRRSRGMMGRRWIRPSSRPTPSSVAGHARTHGGTTTGPPTSPW